MPRGWCIILTMAQAPITRVLLLTPYSQNDRRWQSIRFTPAALLLASGLEQHGFHSRRRLLPLPVAAAPGSFCGFDAIGLTLFEDLAAEYPALIERIRQEHSGLLIAGGPMASRLPRQCLQLFPEIDLLLRGEAEVALPRVLSWLNAPGSPLPQVSGLFSKQDDGWFTLDPDRLNQPQQLDAIRLDYSLLDDDEFAEGLEINISRGCPRSCLFCCHVQGRSQRRLSPAALDGQLRAARQRIERLQPIPPRAMTCNINDDDLLLQRDYALQILDVCRRNGFRLWGLQTAVDSFFTSSGQIDGSLIEALADPGLYQDQPLLWLGSDAFLPQRSRRLGKTMPPLKLFLELLGQFERHSIRHYHYWISSDADSDWPEFISELNLIQDLRTQYPGFGLLAHAPFLIPYPDTPLWRHLQRNEDLSARIRYDQPICRKGSTWQRALRIEPDDPELTRLLDNQPDCSAVRFFDALKDNDEYRLYSRVYNALRESRLRSCEPSRIRLLSEQEEIVADRLGRLV